MGKVPPFAVYLYVQDGEEAVFLWLNSVLDKLEEDYRSDDSSVYYGLRAGVREWVTIKTGFDDGFTEVGFSNASGLWPGTAQFARDACRQLGRIVRWSPDEPHAQGDYMELDHEGERLIDWSN